MNAGMTQFCCLCKELKKTRVELKLLANPFGQRAKNLRRLIEALENQLNQQVENVKNADLYEQEGKL